MSRHHDTLKNDPKWKAARAACLERDGHSCTSCGATPDQLVPRVLGTSGLQVDHIRRISDGGDKYDLDNLQTLCETCHEDKEREYDRKITVRLEWINPRYPELGIHIGTGADDAESLEDSAFIL